MENLPPVASDTYLATLSPPEKMASALRGKLDARRQFRVGASWAMAGAARVAPPAAAPKVAFFKKERRCMQVSQLG
ncbi:hypothetical protein D3C73_1435070 [compost metagenome]